MSLYVVDLAQVHPMFVRLTINFGSKRPGRCGHDRGYFICFIVVVVVVVEEVIVRVKVVGDEEQTIKVMVVYSAIDVLP